MLRKVLICVCLFLIGCLKEKEEKGMDLSHKKVVMVVASKDFRDEEYEEPKELFEKAKVKVVVASSRLSESKGYFGAIAKPEILIKDINVSEYDAIVFVGGSGASEYFKDPHALKLARDAFLNEKIVAAICIAPSILANAGILKGKRATAFSTEKDNLIKNGAIWSGNSVEVDGNIVTADGPKVATKFGNTILELLTR